LKYVIIPDEVTGVGSAPRDLYGYILRLHVMRNGCFAQNKYFCDLMEVSDRQIRRYLNALQKKGYIMIWHKRDSKHRYVSRQIIPKIKIDKYVREKK
jgi:transcription initiation factor IIE alpha subunit